ncbi:4-hydroxyphenylacetate 3-monooxygenase [Saccharopolyspora kobensis]|uniref:4-hydroxyphenylacetate 3-monooxygenase n=1 Tax=Saccharopolyspora kobensis TaxID=146035 RepID=A0A1H5W0D0_9PSEU|nr:4-hydroxyphenylacetate 3-monooxygenase, oxygenase component [Saccharopolyspora kobensis]SEF92686.1 4-hydroxyphenylacetate 3-monooxygenase [Saccharopolyspora kobensis]SFD70982.1 4-hydroxyphenylacetate 3-monooxygenase [Saccharopolyspora kobensis]
MGARSGQQYLDDLAQRRIHVQIDGETVTGNTPDHPAFAGVARTYAELFDMQVSPEHRDVLTYESPTSGDRVATSFLVPENDEDLRRRRESFRTWANYTGGMLGRTGDYLNSALMALSQAKSWFGQADPAFGDNIERYYEKVREEDLLCTHTLIPPQVNRSVGGGQQGGGALMAHVVREDDSGIVVRGARMLATVAPIADELLVFPSTVLRGTPEDEPYSFAFAIPTDAPGLRFLARQPLHANRSKFDEPLAARFEESDCVVIFDDVHVPYERVFVLRDTDLCNGFYTRTSATTHMTHQVVTRTVAKSEFFLGLLTELADAIGIDGFQHIQQDLAEAITTVEIGKALLQSAESQAAKNEFGVHSPLWTPLNTARNWYPKASQRLPEIVRKFSASGLMGLPAEQDVFGAAREDVETYLQGKSIDGPDRVRLFKLAFDASTSAFAGRQNLYEHFFFGDPVRMAGAFVGSYDDGAVRKRVQDFLHR